MLKMTDVLAHSLVQDFTHAFLSCSPAQLDEQFNQRLFACAAELKDVVQQFCQRQDALMIAQALDIHAEALTALQQGQAFTEQYALETQKIAACCLALETNVLEQLNIADSLQDYPM